MPPLDEAVNLARRCVPGSGPLEVQPRGAGLVNETYRVLRDGSIYGMRVAAPDATTLGVDPSWERRVLAEASRAGLAPPVVLQDAAAGVLVSGWAAGRVWDEAQVRRDDNLRRMAALVRQIHALDVPPPRRVMAPTDWMRIYEAAMQPLDRPRSAVRAEMRLAWQRDYLGLPPVAAVLCHSDLHALNVLDDGARLVLLDWEYAHYSEPLWDTAAWIANNDLDAAAAHSFLEHYLGRPPSPHESRRQRLLCWAFDYVCLLWSELFLALRGPAGTVEQRVDRLTARLAGRE